MGGTAEEGTRSPETVTDGRNKYRRSADDEHRDRDTGGIDTAVPGKCPEIVYETPAVAEAADLAVRDLARHPRERGVRLLVRRRNGNGLRPEDPAGRRSELEFRARPLTACGQERAGKEQSQPRAVPPLGQANDAERAAVVVGGVDAGLSGANQSPRWPCRVSPRPEWQEPGRLRRARMSTEEVVSGPVI